MYEEGGAIHWETILTILIGIVIVSFIYLLLYKLRKAKHRIVELETEILKKNKHIRDSYVKEADKNIPAQ